MDSRSAAIGRISDVFATQMQRDGRATMIGLRLVDVLVTLDDIGLTPSDVIISGGSLVCGPTAWEKKPDA